MVAFWRDGPFEQSTDVKEVNRRLGTTYWLAHLKNHRSAEFKQLLIAVKTVVGPGLPCWRYAYHVTIHGSKEGSTAMPLERYAMVTVTDIGNLHRPGRAVEHVDAIVDYNFIPLETCLELTKDALSYLRGRSCNTREEASKMALLETVQELFRWKILEENTLASDPQAWALRDAQQFKLLQGIAALGDLTRGAMHESGQSIAVANARANHSGHAGKCSRH